MPNHSSTAARKPGRPKILTTEQVVDAAIQVGLDGLTMASLAKHLGVSSGVLYGYVKNRDELIKLATSRVGDDFGYPNDNGQHWTVYVAENAVAWFKFFTGPGDFLKRYLSGRVGPASEIDRTSAWFSVMSKRGFETHASLLLQRQIAEVVMGAAVTEVHNRALRDAEMQLSNALSARGVNDQEAKDLHAYVTTAYNQIWPKTLITLMLTTASERGERIDVEAVKAVLKQLAYL